MVQPSDFRYCLMGHTKVYRQDGENHDPPRFPWDCSKCGAAGYTEQGTDTVTKEPERG